MINNHDPTIRVESSRVESSVPNNNNIAGCCCCYSFDSTMINKKEYSLLFDEKNCFICCTVGVSYRSMSCTLDLVFVLLFVVGT